MACHLVNHLDPQLHDDPTIFNPDRWMTPSRTVNSVRDNPGSYIPFSIGERQCPGQKFAMAEAAIFFSQFLLQYEYEIVNEEAYQLRFQQQFLREPL
jgi:cytochrome P450